jgi:peptidoglycan/xylan/chitin deacetylase (PgdA/CDA1 family)
VRVPYSLLTPVSLRHLSPNQLTAQQAQESLLADRDPIWQRACRHVAERERLLGGSELSAMTDGAGEMQGSTSPLSLNPLLAAEGCARSSRVLLHVRLPLGCKEIALTFDDGPHPLFTPRLLAVLRNLHVPATFFVVGKMAERAPNLIREEVASGFDVENHTYHHVSLTKLPTEQALDEIEACGMVVEDITGRAPHLFRPPGGRFTAEVAADAAEMGYTTVLWTDDPGDYQSPPESVILARALRSARNGGILLLHDGIPATIDALPVLVADLRAQGYTIVSARQLAHQAFRAKMRGPVTFAADPSAAFDAGTMRSPAE